ncbi:hypothetical protein CDAR_478631 [Caerostris darwini]|uniref:Uncharacterized protein n=1 Tax=Caerostris darwini TaxID=1538125 RepID=A0AAV4QK94_9ARAC|nr:hypothetical protein CDAR_478631 [Caerostris darwini]
MRKEKEDRNRSLIRENRQDKSGGTFHIYVIFFSNTLVYSFSKSPETENKKRNTIYHGLHSKKAHDSNLYLCSYSADPFFCPRLVSAAKKQKKKELLLPRTMDQQPINVQYSTISRLCGQFRHTTRVGSPNVIRSLPPA